VFRLLRGLKIVTLLRFATKLCVYLSLWILTGVIVSYFTYHLFIPKMKLSRNVYFDYDWTMDDKTGTKTFPRAKIDLLGPDFSREPGVTELYPRRTPPLSAAEIYEVHLKGRIPRTPRVRSLGAVMVKLKIYSCSGEKLVDSSRAVVLPYQSPLIQLFREMFWILLFMFGVKKDQFWLDFTLLDGYIEPSGDFRSCRAEVILSNSELLFFEAKLEFQVQLTSIMRRAMYWSWPFSLFVGTVIAMICLCPCCLLCMYQSAVSSTPAATPIEFVNPPEYRQQSQVQAIEQEDEQIEDKPDEKDDGFVTVPSPHLVTPVLLPQAFPKLSKISERRNLLDTPSDGSEVIGSDQEIDEFTTPPSLSPASAILSGRRRCSPLQSFLANPCAASPASVTSSPVIGPQSFIVSQWWHFHDELQRRRSQSQQQVLVKGEENGEEEALYISEKKLNQTGRLRRRLVRSENYEEEALDISEKNLNQSGRLRRRLVRSQSD